MQRHLLALLMLALAGVLLLAVACGDDDENGAAGSPTLSASADDNGNGSDATSSPTADPGATGSPSENPDGGEGTATPPDGDGGDSTDRADLCDLFTVEQVEEVLETGIARAAFVRRPDGVSCQWFIDYTLDELDDGGAVEVRIYTEGAEAALAAVRAEHDVDDTAGPGDEAFYAPDIFSFYARTGDKGTQILDASYPRAWERPDGWQEELAELVLDSLP